MNGKTPARVSFAALDRQKGIPEPGPTSGDEYPLEAWYRSVRQVPLDELATEDICKAVRQSIHIERVVPLALRVLESDPAAGELYDSELLASLKAVPAQYWREHPIERRSAISLIEAALADEQISDDVRRDGQEVLSKTGEPR